MTTKNILIIDDCDACRELLELELTDWGFRPITVKNAYQAFSTLETMHIDLIVLDVEMKPLSGVEAFKVLSRDFPTIPVVVFTAYGTAKLNEFNPHPTAFLMKKADLSELKMTIQTLTTS